MIGGHSFDNVIFYIFKLTLQVYNNICESGHPVQSTGIRTHDPLDVSLLP